VTEVDFFKTLLALITTDRLHAWTWYSKHYCLFVSAPCLLADGGSISSNLKIVEDETEDDPSFVSPLSMFMLCSSGLSARFKV